MVVTDADSHGFSRSGDSLRIGEVVDVKGRVVSGTLGERCATLCIGSRVGQKINEGIKEILPSLPIIIIALFSNNPEF